MSDTKDNYRNSATEFSDAYFPFHENMTHNQITADIADYPTGFVNTRDFNRVYIESLRLEIMHIHSNSIVSKIVANLLHAKSF